MIDMEPELEIGTAGNKKPTVILFRKLDGRKKPESHIEDGKKLAKFLAHQLPFHTYKTLLAEMIKQN